MATLGGQDTEEKPPPGPAGTFRLRKLDGLNIGFGAEPEGPDERNVVTAGGDVVVVHRINCRWLLP
jgi:hypothetical protein